MEEEKNWWKSKRFVLGISVLVIWIATVVHAMIAQWTGLALITTPACLVSIGVYQGWETRRPSGFDYTPSNNAFLSRSAREHVEPVD